MSGQTVLVIDDSATIRRLVDMTLSPVGYRVVLAATAEEGMDRAREVTPALIVLDHQLPGTTGTQVCRQLLEDESLRNIPVVASSTLRKRAYVEYADCPNVVDMLPKPYTPELLVTTVAHTLDTGHLVVDSQRDGTAVPEVYDAPEQMDLQCNPATFRLREVLDFLTNTEKEGRIEVELDQQRIWIFVGHGRIQAVTASGIDVEEVTRLLPDSLEDLGPVLQLTVQGGSCSQIQGLVQLLDNKVLDPRLLRKLLRHQASILLHRCLTDRPTGIRFAKDARPPALHSRLPLDTSAVALLVEAALRFGDEANSVQGPDDLYVRRSTRGLNLDRAGLSATHQKLLSMANDPITPRQAAEKLQIELSEAHWVLEAMVRAELLEPQGANDVSRIVLLELDKEAGGALRDLAADRTGIVVKVVRDKLTYQLVSRRHPPHAVVCDLDGEAGRTVAELAAQERGNGLIVLGIAAEPDQVLPELRDQIDDLFSRPYQPNDILDRCLQLLDERQQTVVA